MDKCWLKQLIEKLTKNKKPEPLITYQEALEQMNKEAREKKK